MKAFLLALEEKVENRGWDQPALLGLMVRNQSALGLGVLDDNAPEPVAEFLTFFSNEIANDTSLVESIVKGSPEIIGVILISSNWKFEGTAEELKAVRDSGKSLADVPGAVGSRGIACVDMLGRYFHLMHDRGKAADVHAGGGNIQFGGPVVQALYKIATSIARAMPDNEQYIAALESTALIEHPPFE